MIEGGYFIKARKIQDSDISLAPPHVREIWDWLLKEVNHTDIGNIKRGSTVRSLEDMRQGLKWFVGYRKEMYSKSKCEMAAKWLRKHGMIETTKTTRGMLLTVCNYDLYQNPKNYETNNEKSTKPTRSKQPFPTINKNEKNEKNETKEKEIIKEKNWRNDFEIYKAEIDKTFNKLKNDSAFISEQQKFNPNVDIILTMEKSIVNFWATEAGWKNKKKTKTENPDWKLTLTNAISNPTNRVWIPRDNQIQNQQPIQQYKHYGEG